MSRTVLVTGGTGGIVETAESLRDLGLRRGQKDDRY
jgi:NAD(P)-dependent dehydrogenase (short-subunit alcohol dehydrogenase family)